MRSIESLSMYAYSCKVMLITTSRIRTVLDAVVAARFLADELRVDSGNGHSGTEATNLSPESCSCVCCRLLYFYLLR